MCACVVSVSGFQLLDPKHERFVKLLSKYFKKTNLKLLKYSKNAVVRGKESWRKGLSLHQSLQSLKIAPVSKELPSNISWFDLVCHCQVYLVNNTRIIIFLGWILMERCIYMTVYDFYSVVVWISALFEHSYSKYSSVLFEQFCQTRFSFIFKFALFPEVNLQQMGEPFLFLDLLL